MKALRFICNRIGHHMRMQEYVPGMYSEWQCNLCGIRQFREIHVEVTRDEQGNLVSKTRNEERWYE